MSYASTTAILIRLPVLPDTTTSEGYSQTVSLITGHVTRADGLINSYLARRYSVPFSPVPPVVRLICEDLTSFFVYRSEFMQDNQNRSEYLDLYDSALEWLTMLKNGDLELVDSLGSLISELSSTSQAFVDANTKDWAPFFDVDSITSWKHDADRLTDIEDNR